MHRRGVDRTTRQCSGDHGRLRAAQEGIGPFLFAQGARNRRQPRRTKLTDTLYPLTQRGAFWLDGESEAQIDLGVFVGAIDSGIVRQGRQASQ